MCVCVQLQRFVAITIHVYCCHLPWRSGVFINLKHCLASVDIPPPLDTQSHFAGIQVKCQVEQQQQQHRVL